MAKITTSTSAEFKPIELKITIESKRELEAWACFGNASSQKKLDLLNRSTTGLAVDDFTYDDVRFMADLYHQLKDFLGK